MAVVLVFLIGLVYFMMNGGRDVIINAINEVAERNEQKKKHLKQEFKKMTKDQKREFKEMANKMLKEEEEMTEDHKRRFKALVNELFEGEIPFPGIPYRFYSILW